MFARRLAAFAAVLGLLGCASTPDSGRPNAEEIRQLLPVDAILLGEQHDAPDHQRIHQVVVKTLASLHKLAGLALEMASQGVSTEKLGPYATEKQVRLALQWRNQSWPWAAYAPAIMAAVRAGVPVYGANLPGASLRQAMADAQLDTRLAEPALKAQQENVRLSHCGMLPESQIGPMTRAQIARDIAMAQTLVKAARPDRTVVLLSGSGHADRRLGVVQHLPAGFLVKAVWLGAERVTEATQTEASFDLAWPARPAPTIDYCASFTAQQTRRKPAPVEQP